MSNENCLEGKACPKCGQDEIFTITAEAEFLLTDDGTEHAGGCEFDDESPCRCSCGFSGVFGDFDTEKQDAADNADFDDLADNHPARNQLRVKRAETALAAHVKTLGEQMDGAFEESDLAGMLADIRHACDAHGTDFFAALDASYEHYLEEKST